MDAGHFVQEPFRLALNWGWGFNVPVNGTATLSRLAANTDQILSD
jgi:hypothetical protein